jgi:2-polyprenyl-3-methyl-5-hydroxy-6-metoxy-1,4-benzoquinol methylase
MKLVNYDYEFERGLKLPIKDFMKATREYKKVEESLTAKYGKIAGTPLFNMQAKLGVIMHKLGEIKGKTILDIGCGAVNSWDYGGSVSAEQERYYDPWLCRVAHELGAKVTGIDGASSPNEEYTHIKENLLHFENIVKQFLDHSIDLACAWSFFDSPNLANGREMFREVIRGLEKKVKPEGFFVFEAVCTGVLNREDWEYFLKKREQQISDGVK